MLIMKIISIMVTIVINNKGFNVFVLWEFWLSYADKLSVNIFIHYIDTTVFTVYLKQTEKLFP